ncbi:MAG: hypothetical protein NVS2B3_15000 [Vulcanimicrobiaceae bacterium]
MTTLGFVALWLGLLTVFAGVLGVLLRSTRLRAEIERVEATRLPALDGLRGILAFSVFVHHAYLTRRAALTGSWGTPDDAFVQLLGLGPVAIFFMITAYLFWSRALAARGRIAALPFYGARLRRIYPAFAGSIVALLAVVACLSRFRLREDYATVASQIARQLSLGIATGDTVNGLVHANLIDAGVTWSLGFECGFYLILPLLALAVRVRATWLAWLFVTAVALAFARHLWIVAAFLPGMALAELATRPRARLWFARYGDRVTYGGCAAVAVAVFCAPHALLTLAHGLQADVALQLAGLVAIFAGLTLGPGPVLLRRIEWRFAGAISYSVYLLHGIVLYVATRVATAYAPDHRLPLDAYLLLTVACVALVAVSATGSYLLLERPFLAPRSAPRPTANGERSRGLSARL